MNKNPAPILVTGVHRGGTTWVGRMLAADSHTAYISEPLNVLHRPGVFRAKVKHWYTRITEENESEYLPAFRQLLNFQYHTWLEVKSLRSYRDFLRMGRDFHSFLIGSLQGQRALIKDPFAVFSTPWFAEKLNCQIVVSIRHPAAFAGSLKRLNWNFDFNNLLNQPLLMRDHLESDRAEMESISRDDIVSQAALLWRMIYRFVHLTRDSFPNFHIVRHEDLSLDPINGYKSLYESLGLTFDDRVEKMIINSSSSENPSKLGKGKTHSVKLDSRANLSNWKNILSAEEINNVRKITEPVFHHFYTDNDW